MRTCNLNKKVNYHNFHKHRISYLTGTCYNFELEECLGWFRVTRVCQRQLGFLVVLLARHLPGRRCLSSSSSSAVAVPSTHLRTVADRAASRWKSRRREHCYDITDISIQTEHLSVFSFLFPMLSFLCTVTAVFRTVHIKFLIMIMIIVIMTSLFFRARGLCLLRRYARQIVVLSRS